MNEELQKKSNNTPEKEPVKNPNFEPPSFQENFQSPVSYPMPRRGEFPPIQRKLSIGKAGDQYEQEADNIARKVVKEINSPQTPPVQTPTENNSLAAKVQRQVIKDSQSPFQTLPQQDITPENGEFHERIRRQVVQDNVPQIQMMGLEGGTATPDFEKSLNSTRGGGTSLDSSFREKVEPVMGADFSQVKVHTDTKADNLSRSINAQAFTSGNDIYFAQGKFNTSTPKGQELVTHELTHNMQQTGSGAGVQSKSVQRVEDGNNDSQTNGLVKSTLQSQESVIQRRTKSDEELNKYVQVLNEQLSAFGKKKAQEWLESRKEHHRWDDDDILYLKENSNYKKTKFLPQELPSKQLPNVSSSDEQENTNLEVDVNPLELDDDNATVDDATVVTRERHQPITSDLTMWTSGNFKEALGETNKNTLGKSKFKKIVAKLDLYTQETNTEGDKGHNRPLKQKKVLNEIQTVIDSWHDTPGRIYDKSGKNVINRAYVDLAIYSPRTKRVKYPRKKAQRDAEYNVNQVLNIFEAIISNQLDVIGTEMKQLDMFRNSVDAVADGDNFLDKLGGGGELWTPTEFEKFTFEGGRTKRKNPQGPLIKKILQILVKYHVLKQEQDRDLDKGIDFVAEVKALQRAKLDEYNAKAEEFSQKYSGMMDGAMKRRNMIIRQLEYMKILSKTWLDGHEKGTNQGDKRKNRRYAILRFIALLMSTKHHWESNPGETLMQNALGQRNDDDGREEKAAKLGDAEGQEEAEISKLSLKYTGNFESNFTKLAPAIDAAVPNVRDKSKLTVKFLVPFPPTFISFNILFSAERKEADKLKIRGEFTVGSGVSDFTTSSLELALGGYLEVQGNNAQNCMLQLSYGLYRRFRESRALVPWFVTDTLWGKIKGDQDNPDEIQQELDNQDDSQEEDRRSYWTKKYDAAEEWAFNVEKNVFAAGKGAQKPDDVYADLGYLVSLTGSTGFGDIASIAGNAKTGFGRRYNKNTIEKLKLGGGKLSDQEKYQKHKKYPKKKQRTKPRGKHYVMVFFNGNAQLVDPAGLFGAKGEYKYELEYTGQDDRGLKKDQTEESLLEGLKTMGLSNLSLYKSKHYFNVSLTGLVSQSTSLILPGVVKLIRKMQGAAEKEEVPKQKEQGLLSPQQKKGHTARGMGRALDEAIVQAEALSVNWAEYIMNEQGQGNDQALTNMQAVHSADGGLGFDLKIENKWKKNAKGENVIKEWKIEYDIRRLQKIKFKFVPLGQDNGVSHQKRAGIIGWRKKQKIEYVLDKIDADTRVTKYVPEKLYKEVIKNSYVSQKIQAAKLDIITYKQDDDITDEEKIQIDQKTREIVADFLSQQPPGNPPKEPAPKQQVNDDQSDVSASDVDQEQLEYQQALQEYNVSKKNYDDLQEYLSNQEEREETGDERFKVSTEHTNSVLLGFGG